MNNVRRLLWFNQEDSMKVSGNILSIAVLAASWVFSAQVEMQLTVEQQKEFLLKAKVIKSDEAHWLFAEDERITLSDGRVMHDAHFQVGSYSYNLAAYELAQLVGLGDMMPVTVERGLFGPIGSLAWWLPVQMNEAERLRRKIEPPDPVAWLAQIYSVRVFAYLVYDTNRNPANLLIDKDWKLYMVDFTRAFWLHDDIRISRGLLKCSRELFNKFRKLNESEVIFRTKKYLNPAEIQAVMRRRGKIVTHFEKLITEKGEAQVLY